MLTEARVLSVGGLLWLVAGFHEATAGRRDPRLSRSASAALEMQFMTEAADPEVCHAGKRVLVSMIMCDPPEHTRLRKFFRAPFLPRAVAQWQENIEVLCNQLLDAIPRNEVVDLKAAFAHPIPQHVICRILGVPPEDDEKITRWGHLIVNIDRSGNATDETLLPARYRERPAERVIRAAVRDDAYWPGASTDRETSTHSERAPSLPR